jgi:hypothetical protein
MSSLLKGVSNCQFDNRADKPDETATLVAAQVLNENSVEAWAPQPDADWSADGLDRPFGKPDSPSRTATRRCIQTGGGRL